MIEIPNACVAQTTNSNIVFRENKARICFLNPNRKAYDRITVDGCVIRKGNKCDFLLTSCEYGDQYFVELKGENLEHAIVQLESTFAKLLDGREGVLRKAFVVSSNSGMRISPHRQQLEKRFKKQGIDLCFFHSQSMYQLER